MLPDLFRDDVFSIETKRLRLRWPRAADAEALQRIASHREVAEMTATWPHPLPALEAERRILRAREANTAGRAFILAVTRKREPWQQIGALGLHEEKDGGLGLGYLLDPQLHNRGYMTEAVRALVSTVLACAPYPLVRASCVIGNEASRRVLDKAGFAYVGDSLHEAPARGTPRLCHDFELTRSAWRAQGQARRALADRALEEAGVA